MMSALVRRSMSLAAVGALAALALVPASSRAQTPSGPQNVFPGSLVSSGQGESKVTPDRVSVLVNVQTRALTASAAASDNAKRTRAVLDALSKLGLTNDQLSTEGYSAYPEMQYDKDGGKPRVTGYVVTNTIKAESKRVEQAGAIIDVALAAGANMINSLSFYAESIEAPRRLAIGLAVANARADAEAMAAAAGGSLGALIELSTQGPTVPPRPMYDMAARGKVAMVEQTPINPGQQTVSVFVSARWQFVPKQ